MIFAYVAHVLEPLAASAPSGLVILGMAIIGIALIMRSTRRRWVQSRPVRQVSVRERYEKLSAQNHASQDAERVMTELDELSRQIHGRIDAKIAVLEAVIRDADDRIDMLSRITRQADGQPGLDVTLGTADPLAFDAGVPHDAVDAEPDGSPDATNAQICSLADGGLSVEEIAERLSRPTGEVELILSLRKAKRKVRQISSAQPR